MKVAVAVIQDASSRILLSRRPMQAKHGAGLWEFPGGKLEAEESAEQALVREIHEELGLQVLSSEFLIQIDYKYPSHAVQLLVFLVKEFSGEASAREGQMDLRWVSLEDMEALSFPEANQPILLCLKHKSEVQ